MQLAVCVANPITLQTGRIGVEKGSGEGNGCDAQSITQTPQIHLNRMIK